MNDLYELEEVETDEPVLWPKENTHPLTSLNKAMENLSVVVNVAIKAIKQMVTAVSDYVYKRYPNRRVVHLALHGKRARTRKKNRNRIMRDLKKEMKRTKKGTIPNGRKNV